MNRSGEEVGGWGRGMKGKGGGRGRSTRVATKNRELGMSGGHLGRSQDSGELDELLVHLFDEAGNGGEAL